MLIIYLDTFFDGPAADTFDGPGADVFDGPAADAFDGPATDDWVLRCMYNKLRHCYHILLLLRTTYSEADYTDPL